MNILTIDIETRSATDLKTRGRANYMNDKAFEIVLFAYKVNDMPTGILENPTVEELQKVITDFLTTNINSYIVAHNAKFELAALAKYDIDIPLDRVRDTMLQCQYHGLPMSLEAAAKYLNTEKQKLTVGRNLIEYFTKPIHEKTRVKENLPPDKIFRDKKDNPAKWEMFKEYCKYDVEVAYAVFASLPQAPDFVWTEWQIDYNINAKGILIDKRFCERAVEDLTIEADYCKAKLKELTGLDNPGSRMQLKQYFSDIYGISVESFDRAAINYYLNRPDTPKELKSILKNFSSITKTSGAKYAKALDLMTRDDEIKDFLNFYGGRTGRWSSWGLQIHNMKRISIANYKEQRQAARDGILAMFAEDIADTYSQLIRTMIIAPPGYKLIIADFAQIEARVLQWLAKDEETLKVFKSGQDYYTHTAATMFNKKYADIPKESEERRKGKIAALALGYGGGPRALDRSPAANDLTAEEKASLVKLWRNANSKVVRLWDQLNAAYVKCYHSKETVELPVAFTDKLIFRHEVIGGRPNISVELPSGRRMYYPDVQTQGRNYVFYGKSSDDQFAETYVNVYGGFLAENITQAIARDCLQIFINRLVKADFKVAFHVHDEVIIEVPTAQVDLKQIEKLGTGEMYYGLPVATEPQASEYYDK